MYIFIVSFTPYKYSRCENIICNDRRWIRGVKMVKFKIYENIWRSEKKYDEYIELNYMTWAKGEPKFDLRKWSEDGSPRKGVTLTEDELKEIYETLKEYFDDPEVIGDNPGGEPASKDNHVLDFRTFLIHSGDCEAKGHDLEVVTAFIFVSSALGKVHEVSFRAKYCRTCKHYYITKDQFKDLKKKGNIMCLVMSAKQYEEYKKGQIPGELKPESKLHMAGYNLTDNLTDKQRRDILIRCIESGWMTGNEIISHLGFLIELNESKGIPAVEIWRKDRDFLYGYRSDGSRVVGVKYFVDGKPFIERQFLKDSK